jgi:hypothetical protein
MTIEVAMKSLSVVLLLVISVVLMGPAPAWSA